MEMVRRISGFMWEALMALRCGSWQLAKELDEGHRRLIRNSVWLGERRREDEGE